MNEGIKLTLVIKNIDGGTGTFLKQILNIGKPVEIISILALEEQNFFPIGVCNIKYCRRKNIKYDPLGRISATKILLKEFLFIAKELSHTKPDVIIAIDTHCNLLVSLVKLIFKIKSKLILSIHNNTSGVFAFKHHLFPVWFIRLSGKLLFGVASCIIGVSKGVTKDIIHNFDPTIPVYTIYYGLNFLPAHLLTDQLPSDDRKIFDGSIPTIITVSRLAGQKDISTLLNACEFLSSKKMKYKLIIVGDGKQKNEFIEMVKKKNLEKTIHFLGWKSNIYPYLKHSDIFVLSTHYEGFPFVLLEAMKAGLPIISTDVSFGPRELLRQDEFGLLTKPGDSTDMSEKISSLLTNQKLRKHYKEKSLSRIEDFTESKMLERYRKIIERIFTEDEKT
ncbi:glycosyltransferase [Candidatus Gottesmanbacteria bacterium]|nr:glycosyltransferase [Candidatus Gottesmanbacteria bacterium]